MWMFFLAAALATELVPEWDAHGTAISPQTALDAALIEPAALARRASFLQRASESSVIGDVVLQLFRVTRTGPDSGHSTYLIAERDKMRSHVPLFEGENGLLGVEALAGGLFQVNWGSDAEAYATIIGFDSDGVVQKVAQNIPIRIGLSELQLSFPSLGRMVIRGRSLAGNQNQWIGRHTLKLRPPREAWIPREDSIPLGRPAPPPPGYDKVGELRLNDYALQWGHHGTRGPTHDAVWVYTPQGTVPLLSVPNQNGRPARLSLRAFRRLHGHVYWAEVELVVAGVARDNPYYLGWILKLRRDEARIVADQIPVRDGDKKVLVDVPNAAVLSITPVSSEISYWQKRWLGTWPLD